MYKFPWNWQTYRLATYKIKMIIFIINSWENSNCGRNTELVQNNAEGNETPYLPK
jgi:hypothetical protein